MNDFQIRHHPNTRKFLVFTPSGNPVRDGSGEIRRFPTMVAAAAWVTWLRWMDVPYPGRTKTQKRTMRNKLGALIGMSPNHARGFFQ